MAVRRGKRAATWRTASRQGSNLFWGPGDTEECQPYVRDHSIKPRYDQSLHLALSELISMGQLSSRVPIPALSLMGLGGGSQMQEVESLALRLGSPQLGFLKPSLLCVPRGATTWACLLSQLHPMHLLPSPKTYAAAPHPANITCSL